jgi:glycosyltransferase involved in cell wall biosynthesis
MIDISIIIPTKNEEKNLKFLLEDIKNQVWKLEKKPLGYEIIVSDANSKDNTIKIAKNYNCKIVKGGLPSVGRNNGAKIAKGKILFFLDADVRIFNKKFFISSLKEFTLKKLDCAVVDNYPILTKQIPIRTKNYIDFIFDFSNFFIRLSQYSKNPRAIGTCMIFNRKRFLKINGFNKKIYFGEDSEIVKRMKKHKYKFFVLNKKLFIHTDIRRILKKGLLKYVQDAIVLDFYRSFNKEITSKKLYEKLTRIKDHFEK